MKGIEDIEMIKNHKIYENNESKIFRSKNYNYSFSKVSGLMKRWGRTEKDDPVMAPSNEILDIETSTFCNKKSCDFCYKGNSSNPSGKSMSLQTYKKVLNKFPHTKNGTFFLQQTALGIGSVSGCFDLFDIMRYTREELGIIPNLTVNGKDISDQQISDLANVCGAIAVSHYNDKECFDTIYRLSEAMKEDSATLKQVNIHKLFASESYDSCIELLNTIENNEQLNKNLNAVVFLSLKPRGPTNTYTPVDSVKKIKHLLSLAQSKNIAVGCDSCSAPGVLRWAKDTNQENVVQSVECCESCLSSFYVSVDAMAYPCSFMEGIGDWKTGINMLDVQDFQKDVWFHPRIIEWRKNLISSSSKCDCDMKQFCRSCPAYDITPCKENTNE